MLDENVALYIDFENLAISADETYPSKDKPLLIGPIVDFANTKGNLCIKKAYADWSKNIFLQYQRKLIEHGFELIHLPETTTQGKNGSDVRLAVDAMESLELFKTINIYIIGSGDTDYIPLIQRIRARGKKVIVMGFEHSVGRILKVNATEYKSMEELLGQPGEDSLSSDFIGEIDKSYGRDLMVRYSNNITDHEPIPMSKLKMDLLRLDPSFSEKKLGFSSFKKFVESLVGDVVDKIEMSEIYGLPEVLLMEKLPEEKEHIDIVEDAKLFLKKSLKYIDGKEKRLELSQILFEGFKENPEMSMHDMIGYLNHNSKGHRKSEIRKFINILSTGNSFRPVKSTEVGPLLSRPYKLKETIDNYYSLEKRYINRINEIMSNRYPDLDIDNVKTFFQ